MLPAAPPGVLGGTEAGFGAAVTLSVRSSNWIPNTQRLAETLGRGESKGRGVREIKRGILPGPQRLQREGREGTSARGCPSGGRRGGERAGRARAGSWEAEAEGPAFLRLVLPHFYSCSALGLYAIQPALGNGHPSRPNLLLPSALGSVLRMLGKA